MLNFLTVFTAERSCISYTYTPEKSIYPKRKTGQEQQCSLGLAPHTNGRSKDAQHVLNERRLLQTAKSGWEVAMDQPVLPGGNTAMAVLSLTTT